MKMYVLFIYLIVLFNDLKDSKQLY